MTEGQLQTIDSRPALRIERRLDHSVERVWRAISDPDELGRWFVTAVEWKPEAGEQFEAEGLTGEITDLEAPRLIAYTCGGELFRFELQPEDEGCLLVFTHVFDDPARGAQHATGWEIYLTRLDFHLAGEFLSEQEAHDAFRPVTLEEGPQLRLERRYDHPPERIWRAITEPDERRHWFPPGEDLEVTESDPPRLLAGEWYGDRLRFELRHDGEGCVLVFCHEFRDRGTAARDAAGWDRCFARFQALLAGEPMSEAESLEAWPATHERYAARFGVDPEVGRKAFEHHAG